MEGFPKSPETEDSVVLRDNVRERESSPEGPWGFSVGCRRYSTSTVVLVVFLRAAHKRLPKNIKPDSASSHTLPHTTNPSEASILMLHISLSVTHSHSTYDNLSWNGDSSTWPACFQAWLRNLHSSGETSLAVPGDIYVLLWCMCAGLNVILHLHAVNSLLLLLRPFFSFLNVPFL